MALSATIVPPVTGGGGMGEDYFTQFLNDTVGSGQLIQILERGSRLVLVYDDGN